MPRLLTDFVITSVACILAGTAGAEAPTKPPVEVPRFESLDRNSDNRLSRSEAGFSRFASDIFVASDLDGDGFITREEYTRATSSLASSGTLASH